MYLPTDLYNLNIDKSHKINITNTLGQTVWEAEITQQEYQIDINTFGDYGTYFISIYDDLGSLLDVRKIILE